MASISSRAFSLRRGSRSRTSAHLLRRACRDKGGWSASCTSAMSRSSSTGVCFMAVSLGTRSTARPPRALVEGPQSGSGRRLFAGGERARDRAAERLAGGARQGRAGDGRANRNAARASDTTLSPPWLRSGWHFLRVAPIFVNEGSCILGRMRALGDREEHTSELQSRQYLVCRLLLEKKKHHNIHKASI